MKLKDCLKKIFPRGRGGGINISALDQYVTAITPAKKNPQVSSEKIENPSSGLQVTDEFKKAYELISGGCPVVLVTGGAGTGKSTFIAYLRNSLQKNIAVVAPTGIAALNIKGQTIHSFFGFEIRPMNLDEVREVNNFKIFKKLEILIIDEVSMVRADLLDCIERFLQLNGPDQTKPFGGVQLVVVGDLFQLPPIVDDDAARHLIANRYRSRYFFSARCLQNNKVLLECVEFSKFFRQDNKRFVELLNMIREGEKINSAINEINSVCLGSDYNQSNAVYLTPTNAKAAYINKRALNELPGNLHVFEGKLRGTFDRQDRVLPAPISLHLKVGAQVMFTKNNRMLGWVNGTIGIVRKLEVEKIYVEFNANGVLTTKAVLPETWDNIKFKYDPIEDRIVSTVVGQYTQFPLMPAWAFTIHKSQGKTLEKIVLDLDRGAFSTGQVYVALSRCRIIEDIKLVRPIRPEEIMVDETIRRFYRAIRSTEIEMGQGS